MAAAGRQGPWFLALDHGGAVAAMALTPTAMPSPALTRYSFPNLSALYGVLPRASALALRDAAFDRGLATFNDAGQPQFAPPPQPGSPG